MIVREHGTARGYRQHRRAGEDTCDACRAAWRAYCDEHSRTPTPVVHKPCGTEAAYQRHRRAGETCAECRAAATAKGRERRQAARG